MPNGTTKACHVNCLLPVVEKENYGHARPLKRVLMTIKVNKNPIQSMLLTYRAFTVDFSIFGYRTEKKID